MRFGAYVMLMFCISLVFYIIGYRSIALMTLYNNQAAVSNADGSIDYLRFVGVIVTSAITPQNALGLVVVGIAAAATTLLLGFAAIYIIPIAMLLLVMNYLLYPFSFVFDPSMPDIVKIPLYVFFNLMTMLAVMSFARGGNA